MLGKKGFTLLEAMVAIGVVAIISGPLLNMFLTSTTVGRRSYDSDKANAAAVDTVEKIKAYPYSVLPAEGEEAWVGQEFYARDWNVCGEDESAFRAITTVTRKDSNSELGWSYIPELLDGDTGESYAVYAAFTSVSSGTYELDISQSPARFLLNASQPVLKNTLTPSMVSTNMLELPVSDMVSDVIPIVVDISSGVAGNILFKINNQTGYESALYIYGDYEQPHKVTAEPVSGTISVNYMKVQYVPLTYDQLEVNVRIYRESDGSEIVSYTTSVYLAG